MIVINTEEFITIKNFSRYKINKDGVIFDTKYNKKVCVWNENNGYKMCCIRNDDNKKEYKRVYRLVAETFIPNPNNLPQVNHKDGIKSNCNYQNLEWVTNSDNTQHGYDNDLYKFPSRCHKVNVYLKKEHKFLKTYPSIRNLSRELGVNRKTVTAILKGEKTTNNYEYDFEYANESPETIENIAKEKNFGEEVSRVQPRIFFMVGSAKQLSLGNRETVEDIVQ